MRIGTKILSLFLAVLMFMMALPITAFAAKQETYIKEIRISTAATEDEAKQQLIDNEYVVVGGVNLDEDTENLYPIGDDNDHIEYIISEIVRIKNIILVVLIYLLFLK